MADSLGIATEVMRVLVVDDEALVCWSLGEALTAQGYDVATAGEGRAALELLAGSGRNPDVVLLDYRLPGRDGLTLLPEIQALAPRARVVLMTAYGSPELLARAQALGARVIDKPIDIDRVAELVA